jgi:hypothetical protein
MLALHSNQVREGIGDVLSEKRLAYSMGAVEAASNLGTFECAFRSSLLSITKDPFNHTSWTLVGPIIPNMQTAGVSLLFRDDGAPTAKHLAFVSSYDCFTISLAESTDGHQWAITDPTWMQGRLVTTLSSSLLPPFHLISSCF